MPHVRALLVQNSAVEDFATYRVVLEEAGHRCRVVRADAGDAFPSLDACDLVLVGGTPTSAAEFEGHREYEREWEWLGRALAAGKPCFGVCCGAQVLARLLGASTRRLDAMEIGTFEAKLTPAGQGDALFSGFPPTFPVFHWHRDVFELPPGADALVETPSWPVQAFRKGNVAGVLFHLEFAPRDVLRWTKAYPAELAEAGVSEGRVMGDVFARAAAMKALAARLMGNFCALAEGS
jgi:GMP synthase (glutamine-hydrolysing)